jgi:hypothetical protein
MTIIETLLKATGGLLMPSESEYPFEAFRWLGENELTNQKLLELTSHPADSPVETVALDYLFRNVAYEKEWHDEVQKANVSKFQNLVSTLEKNLTDIKVYRVGTIDIDVYIVGKNEGELAGLSTKVVET